MVAAHALSLTLDPNLPWAESIATTYCLEALFTTSKSYQLVNLLLS